MATLNQCNFIGRLGAKPEIRKLENGTDIASFSIACSETWIDKASKEKKQKNEWVKIVVFGNLVKIVFYLDKGSNVYVSGQFKTREYTDKEGIKKYTTEIVLQGFNSVIQLLDSKPKSNENLDKSFKEVEEAYDSQDMDDDIPF